MSEEFDVEELRAQEHIPLKEPVTLALARAIGAHAQRLGEERTLPIAMTVRLTGRTVFQVALDGSTPLNDLWMMKKIRVAETFHQSTLLVQAELKAAGEDFHARHGGDAQYWFPAGGAVCLRDSTLTFRGVLVVSGLPQVDDHALCREVLSAFE
jgi:uncharacterized protein (UPF0303 family)